MAWSASNETRVTKYLGVRAGPAISAEMTIALNKKSSLSQSGEFLKVLLTIILGPASVFRVMGRSWLSVLST